VTASSQWLLTELDREGGSISQATGLECGACGRIRILLVPPMGIGEKCLHSHEKLSGDVPVIPIFQAPLIPRVLSSPMAVVSIIPMPTPVREQNKSSLP
jgi:hypothetical protein